MRVSQGVESSAEAVKRAVEEAGLTVRIAAEASGIPYSSMRRKLSGKVPFTLSELFLIAEAVGVRPSRFVSPSGDSRPVDGAFEMPGGRSTFRA